MILWTDWETVEGLNEVKEVDEELISLFPVPGTQTVDDVKVPIAISFDICNDFFSCFIIMTTTCIVTSYTYMYLIQCCTHMSCEQLVLTLDDTERYKCAFKLRSSRYPGGMKGYGKVPVKRTTPRGRQP